MENYYYIHVKFKVVKKMTEHKLRIADVLETIESKLAYVPGGRDREGKPILIVNIPTEFPDDSITNIKLEKLIRYLLSIFNDASRRNGICLIVDARKGSWRETRSYIRRTINAVGKYAARTIVIRSDGFWEKRVDNCTKSWKNGEPTYISLTRLNTYVDSTQISSDLGGIKYYDHAEWIQIRIRVEEFERDATDLINKLTDLEHKLKDYDKIIRKKEQEKAIDYYWEIREDLELVGRYILHSGRVLASNMSIETSQDFQDTVNNIHDILDVLESKQTKVEDIWSRMTTNLNLMKEISELEDGVAEVTNWILGPADAMLNFHCNVGFDVTSSENLRREHEELELECRETYGRYAKILHRIESIPEDCLTADLKSQRDFMDFVCRSFAARLERRRNVLITCQRFFRLVSEYFDKTSEVFDKLIMGNRNCNFSEAEEKLKHLESSQSDLEKLLKELIKGGEKLSDILLMPVKDALGRDLDINYGEDIANVRDILDATKARKNIFNDSMELQKLTLKQIILINAYETDAEQTVRWLVELYKSLIENHIDIGCNANEIQLQREELQTFQETAQGTFDYGCQLLSGARVLRISCRLSLDCNTSLFSQLRKAWRQLCSVTQEQLTRLRVCTVFHRSVYEHCSALDDLISTVRTSTSNVKQSGNEFLQSSNFWTEFLKGILENREKLLVNVGRTVRLGRLLRTRLKEPLYSQISRMFSLEEGEASPEPRNLSAIDAISERLAEVTRLAEKLDARLYEAGAKTRIPKDDKENLKEKKDIPSKEISEGTKEILSESEEIRTEEYVTATECSETPVARSRSESFVTMSEYEDENSDVRRLVEIEEHQEKKISESLVSTDTFEKVHDPIMNKNSNVIVDINQNVDDKANVISIIESIEEKGGKVVKEVTEVTTLRVSHDTKFGVASYQLMSNTVTENKEVKSTEGILDASHQSQTNHKNNLSDEKKDASNYSREEITISEVEKKTPELEDSHASESSLSRIVKESCECNSKNLINVKKIKFLETKGNDDSGIEITAKHDEQIEITDVEEREFFEKFQTSGEWLRLKVLEVYPELTRLGTTVEEAKNLSAAHDEVLVRLQSKQSPVEELLRQADQLISTQRPRAEVYAAMAESLGQTWANVNSLLELQKQILDHNVLFQGQAEDFKANAKALEKTCIDTLLPIEIEVVKKFINRIHDLRKTMLSSLMGALQEGRTLLDCLKEISNEGTLDSRPDKIKADAESAVFQVEKWLEELHDQRTRIELLFTNRKNQLEQCLALALLATDLRDLEEILTDRITALGASSGQLGDSSSSAELLLFELKKLQAEAKNLQDRALKITKSTEKFVSSKHFAGEQATEQAYEILATATDYINDLEQYEGLLNRAIPFFDSARSAFTKLDQLEIQLATTDYPLYSTPLARFHAQASTMLTEVITSPLAEGYALLDVTGRGAPNADGIRRTVEELENRKISLLERCTAHKEENLRISRGLAIFFEKYDELRSWLSGIANAFLRGHQDMGSDLPMAKDFYKIHCQLLEDLSKRGDEIDEALAILSGTIIEIVDERQRSAQKKNIEDRVDELRDSWLDCRHTVEARVNLSALYVDFHETAVILSKDVDEIESEFKKSTDSLQESMINRLEQKWSELQPLYMKLTNYGAKFLAEADICTDAYLDIPRARLCVETTLERFANKQLTVTESWENWQTSVVTTREQRIEQEKQIEETTRTLTWASKFGEQLYPIMTSESIKPSVVFQDLKSTKLGILPELKRAVSELDVRIKSVENFSIGDEKTNERAKGQILRVYEHLRTTSTNYQILLESLISIFQNFVQIENKTDEIHEIQYELEKSTAGFLSESSRNDIRFKVEVVKKIHESIVDILKSLEPTIDRVISIIEVQEPPSAAKKEIEKLNQIFKAVSISFETSCAETQLKLSKRLLFCNFADDLDRIDVDLQYLSKQLGGSTETGYRFAGDSLPSAEAAALAFIEFEKTITVLEDRIKIFIKKTEDNFELTSPDLAPVVHRELSKLQERWNQLKSLSQSTQKRINLSIEYFKLLEEAKNWSRDGNKLLIVIARKTSAIKTPDEVEACLEDIDKFLKPGEEIQENRIKRIREFSTKIFGTDRLPQFNEVVVENRETLDSFAVIASELKTLVQNLKNSVDILEEKQKEKERDDETLRQLNIARIEARAAYEAEIEEKRINAEMEKRKKYEHALKSSVSTPTEKQHTIVEETVTSANTTKEIRILQKTAVEESLPVLVPSLPHVHKQVDESKEIKVVKELVLTQAPRFIIPLNDSTVEEGNRFIFECKLENGKPKPEIVWYKDGISILNNPDYLPSYDEETSVCSLTIEETFAEDSARFACKVSNTAGVVETGAVLNIKKATTDQQLSPPAFIKGLEPSIAKKGSHHFLSCTVTGNPLPTVQWFKDDINIDDSPDYVITYNNGEAVLKFLEILSDDKTVYTCTATNKLGQASTSANLEVQEGKEVEVIQTNGISSLSPEPDEDSKEILSSKVSFIKEHRIIEESHIIKIESHTEEMGGRLSQVKPDASAQEIIASKTEVVPVKIETLEKSSAMPEYYHIPEFIQPSVQLPLKDVQVFEGKTVRLDCIIIGQPEPEVIWYHDDQPVKESADFQLLFQGDRCSLIIQEAFLDDAGKYKVVAINSKGKASSECILSVIQSSSPQFLKLISDVIVLEGEDAIFECQVIGEPKPDLRWYFNNEEIMFMQERITMTHDESGNCSLKICTTTTEDKGNYVAKATNLFGEAKAIARLVVNSSSNDVYKREELITVEENLIPPYFEDKFEENRIVSVGNSTTFECVVRGKPAPKIHWLFKNKPVFGKNFLVSGCGERQILTIPETSQEHVGSISCVAENSVGKATCTAQLEVRGEETQVTVKGVEDVEVDLVANKPDMQASSSSEKHFTTERRVSPGDQVDESVLTKMSSSITQSSTTRSSCTKEFKSSTTSSIVEPQFRSGPNNFITKSHVESREYSSQQNGGPPVVQSQKIEEFEKIIQDTPGQVQQERTKIITEGTTTPRMQKPARKNIAPRFVTPVTGMIVDQGSDVILEGIIDGFPQPTITWSKNGQDLKDNVKATFEHNHVRLELKNVNVKDAGRYTCTAVNDVGNASSTADLVVKKTIFPPVFGKRLQAQVAKKGERVIMEVEITGTPEPTVTWYKNDEPLMDVDGQLKQLGNCYLLIIDAAEKRHAGKYMVHATNAGGEAQSIADFAVFEPTPDTMVEVHKTIVYENVGDKNIKLEEKKSELPSAALTAEHIATTTIQPSSTLKTLIPPSSSSSKSSHIRKIEVIEPKSSHKTEESMIEKASRSEYISSTIESHQSETKSEQKFHMKLQHQTPLLFDSETLTAPSEPTITTKTTKISTEETQSGGQPVSSKTTEYMETSKSEGGRVEENEYVETSTIAKKDALSFFESISKESESTPKGPKAMIKLTENEDGNYDVKVNKLTKNYERSTTFHETKKAADMPSKKSVQDISNKFETPIITKGVDNVMIDFPYEQYKLPALNIQRTVLEDTTASGSPIHGTLTISKLVAQSESAEQMLSGFNLVPEPPPEIGYMPKPEEELKKRTDISFKAKQLEECQKKTVDAPIGGVKIFPTSPEKQAPVPEVKKPEMKSINIPPPFELSQTKEFARKEVVEEKCIKRDVHKKNDIKMSTYSPAPSSPPKSEQNEKWWSSTSDLETRSHVSTDLSEYRCQSGASSHFEGRATSPKPSADGLAMEKSWAKSKTSESNRKSWPPPASDNKETTKCFTKKEEWKEPEMGFKTSTHEKRQEMEEIPGGGFTKTNIESSTSLESRSWSTRENHIEQKITEKPSEPALPKSIIKLAKAPSPPKQAPVTMYKAETTKVDHIVNSVQEKSLIEKYSSECEIKKMESSEKFSSYEELKAPGLVKAVPIPKVQLYHAIGEAPKMESENIKSFKESTSMFKGSLATAPKHPVVQLYHSIPEMSKQNEIILEPGTPPEIGYVPPSPICEKKIEKVEKALEMSLKSQPAQIPPRAIRTIPPPIPPKDVRETPPPLPAKKLEPFSSGSAQSYEKSSSMCKYIKSQMIESDYESDFESCRSKFQSYESEEEPKYRHVEPPTPRPPRPKSSEPEPLPPSRFEVPSSDVTGPPRPTVTSIYPSESSCKQTSTMINRTEKMMKQQHYQNKECSQEPILKPGSPPIYVHPNQNLTSKSLPMKCIKPESPKFKVKSFKQESGYMADTDEPFHQREGTSNTFESKQFMESKSYMSSSSSCQKKEESLFSSSPHPQSTTPKQQIQKSFCEKNYMSSTCPRGLKSDKTESCYSWQSQTSSAPSPSRFARGEFRESDYESDYDGRIPPLWKPRSESDIEDHSHKPMKSNLAGKPIKPAVSVTETEAAKKEYERTEEKKTFYQKEDKKIPQSTPKPIAVRQKSVLLPGSPPELAFAPPRPCQGYEGYSGMPYHNVIGTELKKTMRMDESTENSRRVVTVEQTSRVIKFGEDQKLNQQSQTCSTPKYKVPTPTKFIQGQFRESDYESDIDTGKIKPKWTPAESDTDDPCYKKVQPPKFRSSSVPPPQEIRERVVTPMEFDNPPIMASHTQSFEQHLRKLNEESEKLKTVKKQNYNYHTLPMEKKEECKRSVESFGDFEYFTKDMKKAANHVASKHMMDMTSSFKAKTEKFVQDIQSDLKQQSKPILKHSDKRHLESCNDPQAYREEKRMAQYGTKHIDPDTGLIYFKYDFGYEFGIVLPGEGKKTIASNSKTIQGQRRASDIDIPIVHEFTSRQENAFSRASWQNHHQNQPKSPGNKYSSSLKTVKWEPTSESEFSEAEDSIRRKKRGMIPSPPSLFISSSPSFPKWDPRTPSPISLSPSLPSFSPKHSSATTGPPSNVDSIAESPWPSSNGVSCPKEVIQPYLDILPKKAPFFITPLRDIAVVSGQTARFECIVQAEPQPNILWTKDGRIVENSVNYEVYYRNGVCRLVIFCACPSDAGTYVCTATNSLGSTTTSATLQVPGNRRSMYMGK
ncbi:uncharacterized protein [Chelonus insularis]|uniref:uncharacterized protein isoform X3 n=1 Tax=Chelonus insularis TaxID=460826 RepID=UPI00158DE6CD|nr:uncharacterized protein LOC118074224 isoform X3 [Chelonus insularis]